MRKHSIIVLLCSCALIVFTSCAVLGPDSDKNEGLPGNNLTVATDRKEIRKGMSVPEVEEVLGTTKNLLSDSKSRAVMIYDRVSSTSVKRDSSDRNTLVLLGLNSTEDDSSKIAEFTIIIKFDHDNKVYDFDFYPSKF